MDDIYYGKIEYRDVKYNKIYKKSKMGSYREVQKWMLTYKAFIYKHNFELLTYEMKNQL